MQPKISVIVPVYNVEKYLSKCLDSILFQDFEDYEVIIVNDGSTDNSEQVAKEYVEKHPEKFKLISQKNGGLGAARNTGIESASGEYFFFVDSDDTISRDALKTLYELATKRNADIILFDLGIIDENGKNIGIAAGSKNENVEQNLKGNHSLFFDPPSACNKFFKASLFKETGIRFPGRVWYEDLRTIPKLYLKADNILYVNKPLYNYVQRKGSIMNNTDVSRNKEIIDALEDLIHYFKKHSLFDKFEEELEYLAIYHVLLQGSIRVNKLNYKHPLMELFNKYMVENFPDYMNNKYLNEMTKKERIILHLLTKKRYRILNMLLKAKKLVG